MRHYRKNTDSNTCFSVFTGFKIILSLFTAKFRLCLCSQNLTEFTGYKCEAMSTLRGLQWHSSGAVARSLWAPIQSYSNWKGFSATAGTPSPWVTVARSSCAHTGLGRHSYSTQGCEIHTIECQRHFDLTFKYKPGLSEGRLAPLGPNPAKTYSV